MSDYVHRVPETRRRKCSSRALNYTQTRVLGGSNMNGYMPKYACAV